MVNIPTTTCSIIFDSTPYVYKWVGERLIKPNPIDSITFSSLKSYGRLNQILFYLWKKSFCPYSSQYHRLKLLLFKKEKNFKVFLWTKVLFTYFQVWFALLVAIFLFVKTNHFFYCFPKLFPLSFYGSYYSNKVSDILRLRKIWREMWNWEAQQNKNAAKMTVKVKEVS